jgi:hypothetical protein
MIERYSFVKVGDIELVNDLPTFLNTKPDKRHGFVYLWIENDNGNTSIVYVGKAGKTVIGRLSQHRGGFKNSGSGRKHVNRFRDGMARGCTYEIWARKSETQTLFGEEDIPMECVEELAFIKKFQPKWNTA